ncbi:MAG: hypothetical protein IJW19_00275 [Clostridia bacterium]|nr:hypothetical protein [Clostridia bacterium]
MSLVIAKNGEIRDERNGQNIFNGGEISICYTLDTDDIKIMPKKFGTPYNDRTDDLVIKNAVRYGENTQSTVKIEKYRDGILIEATAQATNLSQYGVNLPFNFMGKKNGGGWKRQYLFNSPYMSSDKSIIYAYLTNPEGNNLVVAILSRADGWKMDYSHFAWAHYFINLKLLANYDRAYGVGDREKHIRAIILPVDSFSHALGRLSEVYGVPFLEYNLSGGAIGDAVELIPYGEPNMLIERINGVESIADFSRKYIIKAEGVTELIPVKDGKRGATVTLYGYSSLVGLYKKSMDTVNTDIIMRNTNGNLCEHQCWAPATMRYMMKYGNTLTDTDRAAYEKRLGWLLDIVTEQDPERAIKEITILDTPHGVFPPYNVYKSPRVQELFFGITILTEAYLCFKDEKFLRYARGATECLFSHYFKEDGHLEVYWGSGEPEDYTTVCCPMIPIVNMAELLSTRDKAFSDRCYEVADKMASYLCKRGVSFPTEGEKSSEAEDEMEDGSISCTALALLYYCARVKRNDEYLRRAKEILDLHECWVINTPICQMRGSSLRWWETQWEGDADGPALCCGHAWTIWRAEADYHYYALTGNKSYLIKAKNGFMTNLSKIDKDGKSYASYNPDEINGGGFNGVDESIRFRIAPRFPDREDCGLSRYVWLRINDTGLLE